MRVFQLFGIGEKRLFSQGVSVKGTITDVKTCWWLKINTKPVRRHALDGAIFPHIITYRYAVSGKNYEGRRMLSAYARCPHCGEAFSVFYDPSQPARSAVRL